MLNLGNFREGSGRALEHSGFRLRGCLFVLLLGVRKRCSGSFGAVNSSMICSESRSMV